MIKNEKPETLAIKTARRLTWIQPGLFSSGFLRIVLLVLVFAFFSIFARNFFTVITVLNIFLQTSTLTILAIGETLVLAVGGVDLSAAAVTGFGGAAVAMFIGMGMPVWQAIITACMACGVIGLANGLLVARLHLPSFIITFAMAMLIPGIAAAFKVFMNFLAGPGAEYMQYMDNLPFALRMVTHDANGEEIVLFPGISWITIIMVIVAALSYLFLAKTRYGRYIYLTGSNSAASFYSGIKVVRIKILAFVLSGMLAGLTGVLITSRGGLPAGVQEGYEFIAIECAMIGGASLSGGTGSIGGTVVGSLIVGTLTVGLEMTMYWNQLYLPLFFNSLILLGAVYLDQRQKRK
jgi:ribose transport system permease protein